MPIVGGLDIHRKQITFDYLDTVCHLAPGAGRRPEGMRCGAGVPRASGARYLCSGRIDRSVRNNER